MHGIERVPEKVPGQEGDGLVGHVSHSSPEAVEVGPEGVAL